MAKQKEPSGGPGFQVGDTVRVKRGVRDPDYPDIPMGGWVGTVKEVECGKRWSSCRITWNRDTLAAIHPVFRRRCERDGLEYEETYLAEEDLEPYDGEPLSIEQPTLINTRPLSPDDQDDRIKLILGATGDDPVPDVDEEMLLAYWRHLANHLALPFEARHCPEDGSDNGVTVVGLLDPDEDGCDEFYGLLCEARLGRRQIIAPLGEIEVRKEKQNHQLIDDYSYWFWNWR